MTPTLAPFEMHCSACASCFCGSFSAFVTDALTPAALRALRNDGLSNCSQRTDDLVSGSRTQTSTVAAALGGLRDRRRHCHADRGECDDAHDEKLSSRLFSSWWLSLQRWRARVQTHTGSVQCLHPERGARTVRALCDTSFVVRSGADRPPLPQRAAGPAADPWSMPNSHGQETPSRETCRPATSHGSASTERSVSAAAPRTAAPSPNSDARTSQRRPAARRARARASASRTPSTSHGASGPRHPPSTTRLDVEQVHGGRERDPEVASRLGEALERRPRRRRSARRTSSSRHVARAALVRPRRCRPGARSPPARRSSRGSPSRRTCIGARRDRR